MSAVSVATPYQFFTDSDGQPLENGYIYIGTAGASAQTNPKNIFWDSALSIAAANPVRTSAGLPQRSGSPATIYTDGDYSITVLNAQGVVVYSALNSTHAPGDISADNVIYTTPGAVDRTATERFEDWVSVKDFGAVGDGSTDDSDAIEAADNYASTNRVPLFFPPGSYRIKRTITRVSQSAWFGASAQSIQNIRNETNLFATVADIGDGSPMIRCATSGVVTSVSSLTFENLEFVSDKSVDYTNLSTTTSNGIILVDVSNVKNGLGFTGCSFKNAAFGVRQTDDDPYLDKVTFDRCNFSLLYRAIQCNPTAGLSLANCFIYDCFDWIYTKNGGRANGAEVFLNACSFNNSSFSTEYCCITASAITAVGCWFEGGNHWLYPTKFASAESCYFSEAMSASGSTKYSAAPNDPVSNSSCFMFKGCRIATNTRLLDLSAVTDKTTVSVTSIGSYNGTNFSDAASISTQLTAGLDYEGYGNVNSTDWNVSQHNRKIALGTRYNPSHWLDIAKDGAGSGVYLRITDSASTGGIAGVILERTQSGAGDIRIENRLGDIVVSSATDGATWTEVLKFTAIGGIALKDGVTAPSTAAGYAQLYVDTADGDLKVKFGDGITKTIATDT